MSCYHQQQSEQFVPKSPFVKVPLQSTIQAERMKATDES